VTDLLTVEALSAAYGRVRALHDVSLTVASGECVCLIGANGAGKSTLLRCLGGLLRPAGGRILFDGQPITGVPAERLVRRGVALVPEGRRLFAPMSVAENLRLGALPRGRVPSPEFAEDLARIHALFPVLEARASQAAGTLSGGEQQMLAVARALMSRPRLLLLDEPSLGLAPKVVAEIFGALDALRRDGLTVLLVEQDARLALKHSDRGYVLRTGAIAKAGKAADLLADDDIRLIYLGAWHGEGEK